MAQVILSKVSKMFGKQVTAVDNVNLNIPDGEFIVIVGPSGCGKTTTLRMIAGLEEITSGIINIGDKVVNDVPPKDRDIAMVFQNYALYPHMTVFQNMGFGLKLRKVPKAEIKKQVQDTAELLGIDQLLSRKPKTLSGGQRQRVAVGRAIVRNPKVFLFDEPLSNLDAKLRITMRAELKTLHQRLKTTTIYVTHDQAEAMTLGDRICVMYDGVVQQVAAPMEVYDKPANRFVAGFLGTPPMNFFDGQVQLENGQARFVTGDDAVLLPERLRKMLENRKNPNVILGIRPEHFSIQPQPEQQQSKLQCTVKVVEPLGDCTEVYLSSSSQNNIIASLDPHVNFSTSQRLEIFIDIDKVHLFETGDTGENISLS